MDSGRAGRRGADCRTSATRSPAGEDAGIAKITIDRPEVRNAFRPRTVIEMSTRWRCARGPRRSAWSSSPARAPTRSARAATSACAATRGYLDEQTARRERRRPLPRDRPARADPPPAQAGGRDGRGLRDRRRARAAPRLRPDDRRRQRALRTGRPEGRLLRRRLRRERCCRSLVGPKKAKEIWFLCRQYDAPRRRWQMGLVNAVVPLDRLEQRRSPGAGRCSRSRRSRCGC